MPTATYIPTKVLLHDPDTVTNPKSLYPVTGLNAIVAGVDSSLNATYIATSDTNKIKYQYLEIVNSSGKVDNSYLSITFTSGGKINNDNLDIFTTETYSSGGTSGTKQVIKSELLPSFVDDVVAVPVITNISQASGDLVILESGTGSNLTYTFYAKGANNTYYAGGGEVGKIYTAADGSTAGQGSIFRCVSGSTTQAIRISDNPYAVATTKTNGVYLDTTDGTLTAKADVAAADAFGTVKINTSAYNNVKLTVSNGIIAASAGTANAAAVGVVFAVGTQAEAATLTSAYGETYVVPNVGLMSSFVSQFVPTVDKASYDAFGVVKITNNGNIDCTSGVLTVASAAASVNGVVKIVDSINTAAEGNSSKAVTQNGIVQYVSGQLANYQSSLVEGDGININNATVSVVTSGAVVISSGAVSARNATTTDTGVVLITGDSSYIENGSAAVDGKPVAVNPVAVRDYVSAQIIESGYNLQIASPTTRGGFRTSASATGLIMTTPSGDNTADVLKVNIAAPVVFTTSDNQITVRAASFSSDGVVTMHAIATAAADDASNTAARAYDVKNYVDTASGSAVTAAVSSANAYTDDKIASATVTLVNGNGIGVSGATVWVEKAGGLKFDDNDKLTVSTGGAIYVDTNSAINVSSATTTAGGIVQLVGTSAGIDEVTSAGAVPVASAISSYVAGKVGSLASTAAGYAATSSATTPALGMVRVISSGGLLVTTQGTSAGNISLDSATTGHLGGVKLAATNTGINAATGGVISANTALPIYIDASNNLNISAATTASAGVVTVKNTSAAIVAATGTAEVPNCTGLKDYVSNYVSAGYQETLIAGSGLAFGTTSTTSNTLNAQVTNPIVIVDDYIGIQVAAAETGQTLTSAALGAVYARGTVRDIDTITEDDQGITANTVPTESAVRAALNALPYITYTVL